MFLKKLFRKKNTSDHSKTFCVVPWVHMASRPDGTLNLCCLSAHQLLKKSDGQPYRLDQDKIEDIWNGPAMIEARKALSSGQKISACNVCYKDEKIHKKSLRQNLNAQWAQRLGQEEITKRLNESKLNDGKLSSPPVYFDLRLSNNCNLKCRMCFPVNSQGISNEYSEILESKQAFPPFIKEIVLKNKQATSWGDSPAFIKSMEKFLPFTKEIYFTGGEPTLINAVYDLMHLAVELGFAKNIILNFHTNTTFWNQKLADLWPFFEEVNINCSIDGVDAVDEYVRFPTRFEKVDENFKKYLQLSDLHKNIFISISTAVSWLNIFDLPKLAQWMADQNLKNHTQFRDAYLGIVYEPSFLHLKMIPATHRSLAQKALNDYGEILFKSRLLSSNLQDSLKALNELLQQKEDYLLYESLDLVSHTNALDLKRSQKMAQLIPLAFPVYQHHTQFRDDSI